MPKAIQRSHGQPRHAITFGEGKNFLRKGKQQEAANCFRLAVEQAPSIAEYYSRLAETLGNLQGYKEMLHWCTLGLERCGDDPQLWSYMGIALFNMSHWKDAAVAFGRVTKLRPEFYRGYFLLGFALAKAGDTRLAQTCFELACSKDAKQPEVWNAWGELSLKTGDWQRGLDCFHRVLELQPASVPALNNISSILRRQGRPEAAEPYLREAVRLEPNREEPLRNLAAVLLQLGKHREALDVFNSVLHSTPDNSQALS